MVTSLDKKIRDRKPPDSITFSISALAAILSAIYPSWNGIGPTPLSARFEAAILSFFLSWLFVVIAYQAYRFIWNL
jgi:uncharacterized membrane protein YhdT